MHVCTYISFCGFSTVIPPPINRHEDEAIPNHDWEGGGKDAVWAEIIHFRVNKINSVLKPNVCTCTVHVGKGLPVRIRVPSVYMKVQ